MEKILINSVDKKFGKINQETGVADPFWAIVFNHTQKATVWDETIATNMQANLNGYIMAVLQQGAFKGQPIINIREIQADVTAAQPAPVTAPQMPAAKEKPNPQRVGLYVKLAVEMMVASPQEGKTVEENLCENIQEIKRLEEFTVKLLSQ